MECELTELTVDDMRVPCENEGVMRECGHVACDAHTDSCEDACLFCAGTEEDAEREYEAMLEDERRMDA